MPWFTWKAELLSTGRNTIRSKECQFSICVYKYTCSCMLMAYGASKVWSLKCEMRVYIMYFVCMLMNTHKMRTQSFIVYAPSVKNRIHHTHTFIQNTRAHTCIHQRHNAFRCKNIRSLLLTDSFYRVNSHSHTHTQTQCYAVIWICFGFSFRFSFNGKCSLFLRFPARSSFTVVFVSILCVCVYIFIHTYMELAQ